MKNYREVYLRELATITRAKKGEIYKAGTITIGLSATRGEIGYLHKDEEVPTKWAVVQVDENEHNPIFIYHSILKFFPKFYSEWKTGINLQIDKLDYLKIGIHEKQAQDDFARQLKETDAIIEAEEKEIEMLQGMKKYYLSNLFV